MSNDKSSLTDEIGYATMRTFGLIATTVIFILSLNIDYPKFAKGFDLSLVILLAATVFVNPRLALFCGLIAGFICDLYAGKLSVFHMAFYSLPGLIGPLIVEGVLFRSNTAAGILVFAFIIFKFFLQYLMLFILGQGDWLTAFLRINWWSVFVLVGIVMLFWEKLGFWMAARPERIRFRRGIYGR